MPRVPYRVLFEEQTTPPGLESFGVLTLEGFNSLVLWMTIPSPCRCWTSCPQSVQLSTVRVFFRSCRLWESEHKVPGSLCPSLPFPRPDPTVISRHDPTNSVPQ